MSKKNQKPEAAPAEKVVTKYDLKMQKRQEEKERAAREKRISTITTVVIVAVLVCFALSFPIRSMIAQNKTICTIGDQKIGQVEFDYSYNVSVNNYINTYSAYLSYFGLDPSKDLSTQPYMDNLTWKDYFEESAVESMQRSKALKADAQAAGFTYDVSRDYENFVVQQREAAKNAGVSLSRYVRQSYGDYATMNRIKPFVEEALYVAAYYEELEGKLKPSAEEVEAVYTANPENYDSVDYRILQFAAELPTEPTELADPDAQAPAEGTQYTPSDAEVEKAMADAKVLADAALKTIKTEGELIENIKRSSTNTSIRDWLFDDSRKAGDTSVMEDTTYNRYYCVEFVNRYRNDNATADIRVMACAEEEDALNILSAWKNGAATEESFIELCDGEFYDNAVAKGGLVEGVSSSEDMYEELLAWIFAEGRAAGDCDVITIPDTGSFVVFYSGEGKAEWYNGIQSSLLNDALGEYVDAQMEKCAVVDADGNLNFLKVKAAQEAEEEAGTVSVDVAE